MKHLLIARFQGTLIGGNTIYINPQQIAPNQLSIDATPAIMAGIDSLIRCGGFDEADWISSTSKAMQSHYKDRNSLAILAMTPLILFFHDDRVKLREIIISVSQCLHLEWETCSSAIAIGYIISRSITETFTPRSILAELAAEMTNLHPSLLQQLTIIEWALNRPTSLSQVSKQLTPDIHPTISATAIAIYCFFSTPEDFNLSILRSYHSDADNQLTCAIAGILSGAYNSLTGIPINGDIATQKRAQWMEAAENLLNLWAGFSSASKLGGSLVVSIASPRVIQGRNRF
jgi:ADP-ribosylglycohydrolase